MHRLMLVIALGIACCFVTPVCATEEESPEAEQPCDTESGETCAEEDELERGFDPCLINANLPACKSDATENESGAVRQSESEGQDTDDSG